MTVKNRKYSKFTKKVINVGNNDQSKSKYCKQRFINCPTANGALKFAVVPNWYGYYIYRKMSFEIKQNYEK